MNAPSFFPILDEAGFRILSVIINVCWQSLLLFAGTFCLAWMFRRRHPSVRHGLWLGFLAAVPLVPLITWMLSETDLPRREVEILPRYTVTVHPAKSDVTETRPLSSQPVSTTPQSTRSMSVIEQTPEPADPVNVHQPTRVLSLHKPKPGDYPWALALAAYMCGSGVMLFLVALGRYRIHRWVKNASVVTDPAITAIFRRAASEIGYRGPFRLMESNDIDMPVAVGIIHPRIMIPRKISYRIDDSDLHTIALHEFMHLRRRDPLTLSYASILRALMFFNPALWFASQQISELAEQACDRAVVNQTGDSIPYAALLTRLMQTLPEHGRTTDFAAGIILSRHAFLRRIESLLADVSTLRTISRRSTTGLIFVTLCILATAAGIPLGSGHDDGIMVPVYGTVYNNGAPVNNAIVYLDRMGERFARTGKDGRFSGEISGDRFGPLVYPNPTLLAVHDKHGAGMAAVLRETAGNIQIRLVPYRTLGGTIVDEWGDTVPDARVEVILHKWRLAAPPHGNVPNREFTIVTKSDAKGRFSVSTIPENDSATLDVIARDYARLQGYNMYAPGTEDYVIRLEEGGTLTVTVRSGDNGSPAKDITVHIKGLDIGLVMNRYEVKTGQNGQYSFTNLPEGLWSVYVEHDSLTAPFVSSIRIDQGRITENVDIDLIPGGIITGRVLNAETGAPITGHKISMKDGSCPANMWTHTAVTDDEGCYRFNALPGPVTIMSMYAPVGYVFFPQPRRTATAHPDSTVRVEDIFYRPAPMLSGTVRDDRGNPIPGAEIAAYDADSDIKHLTPNFMFAVSDSTGHFTFSGTPGISRVLVTGTDVCNNLHGRTIVDIASDSTIDLTLTPSKYRCITGRAVTSAGAPVTGATVTLEISSNHGQHGVSRKFTNTNTDGAFLIPAVSLSDDAKIHLRLESPGFKITYRFIEHIRPEIALGDITLETDTADRWIEGRVLDPSGNPLPGVSISFSMMNGLVTTDNEGRYRLQGIDQELFAGANLRHPHFGRYEFNYIPTNRTRDFTIYPTDGHISGHLLDEKGQPVTDASINVIADMTHGLKYYLQNTNDSGYFSLINIMGDSADIKVYSRIHGTHIVRSIPVNSDNLTVVLSDATRHEPMGQELFYREMCREYLDARETFAGKQAPALQADPLTSDTQRPVAFTGQVTLLHFIDTTIDASLESVGLFNYLTDKYGDKLSVYGVHEHTDDINAVREVVTAYGITYPVFIDHPGEDEDMGGATYHTYRILPHYPDSMTRSKTQYVLISRDGKIFEVSPQLPNIWTLQDTVAELIENP